MDFASLFKVLSAIGSLAHRLGVSYLVVITLGTCAKAAMSYASRHPEASAAIQGIFVVLVIAGVFIAVSA